MTLWIVIGLLAVTAALIKMFHSWYPTLRVLFVSGYSEETVDSSGSLFPGALYLAKPFSGETLVRTIRHLLDSPVLQG